MNAFATPNGIVVVHSGFMEMVENEAQLAAVVGHEIAHATHEHTWRQQQFHKKKRIGIALAGAVADAYGMQSLADMATLVNGAIVNGHQRVLENQSDRIGLQYMVDAGYDPRQAPAVWKLMAKKNGVQSTNFFWSSHDNAPTRRSYLMNELKNNYRDRRLFTAPSECRGLLAHQGRCHRSQRSEEEDQSDVVHVSSGNSGERRIAPRRRFRGNAETRRCGSHSESALGVVVRNALPGVEFRQTGLDLPQEQQALDRVVDRGVRRDLTQALDDPVPSQLLRHAGIHGRSLAHLRLGNS